MQQIDIKSYNLAPIVLFVYNRLDHTKQTIEALQKNEISNKSDLFIYSDAAKNEGSKQKVAEVREYIKSINGFKNITIIEREKNYGLANSIIDGVTKIVNEYGKIIVLEDDLITSPNFLKFMNEALEIYKNEDKVYSVTGYSFTDNISDIESSYFLKLTSSWSWGTWADRWQQFKRDKKDLEQIISSSIQEKNIFNFDDSYDYISMAKMQVYGKIDSWAIYWYLCLFKQQGLTLYPAKKLVKNIGFDGSGTHCSFSEHEDELVNFYPSFTKDIVEKTINRNIVSSILREKNKTTIKRKIINKLKKHLSQKQKQILLILFSKAQLLFHKKDIGKNTYIDKTVNVFGWESVSIGSNTLIGEWSWLNVNGRIKNFKHIKIGDYCYLGRRNLLSSSKELIISDYVMTNNDCKFLGSNHIYKDPMEPYIATGTTNDDTLKIGANVWIGAGVIVLGAVSVGHGSIIGAGSIVTKDIPPFSIAVGNPCRAIKRFDFKTNQWRRVENFDINLEKLMPSEEEYLKILQKNRPNINMPIMAATSRHGDLI